MITYISNPLQNENPEPCSKHYNAGCKELADPNLEQNITKRAKTISTRHSDRETRQTPSKQCKMEASTISPMESTVTNNTQTNDTQLHPLSHTGGAAITYNLRSRRQPHHTIKTHRRKKEPISDEQVAHHAHHQPKPNHTPIKCSSAAQAPPRINMAFPTPCSMPHRNPTPDVKPHRNPPMNTFKYKQPH